MWTGQDRNGQNGPNRTKVSKMDRIGPMQTKWPEQNLSGLKWTKWTKQGQYGPNRTKVDKMDAIGSKWIV